MTGQVAQRTKIDEQGLAPRLAIKVGRATVATPAAFLDQCIIATGYQVEVHWSAATCRERSCSIPYCEQYAIRWQCSI